MNDQEGTEIFFLVTAQMSPKPTISHAVQNEDVRAEVSQPAWGAKMVVFKPILYRLKCLLTNLSNSDQLVTPAATCHNASYPFHCATAQPMIHQVSFLPCKLRSVIIVFISST